MGRESPLECLWSYGSDFRRFRGKGPLSLHVLADCLGSNKFENSIIFYGLVIHYGFYEEAFKYCRNLSCATLSNATHYDQLYP